MKHVSKSALAIASFACATIFSFSWSEQGGVSVSVESAQARVGRPLTPMSAAGVARRQTRRAGYGYGGYGYGLAGAAAVGAAGAVAAATAPYGGGWGNNTWGNSYDSYAAQNDPNYGQPSTRTGRITEAALTTVMPDGRIIRSATALHVFPVL